MKGVVQKKGINFCRTAGKVSIQIISEQYLHRDYFQSQLSQVSVTVNFWAWLHSTVHSGSNLVGYLNVSLICLRRPVEVSKCLVRSRPELARLAKTKGILGFLHCMLSPPSKTSFMWLIILTTASHLWATFFNRNFWIIRSLALLFERSHKLSLLFVANRLQLCLVF